MTLLTCINFNMKIAIMVCIFFEHVSWSFLVLESQVFNLALSFGFRKSDHPVGLEIMGYNRGCPIQISFTRTWYEPSSCVKSLGAYR